MPQIIDRRQPKGIHTLSGLIFTILLIFVSGVSPGRDFSTEEKETYKTQQKCCGAAAAYLACRYYGVEAEFEDMINRCRELADGTASLAVIAESLREQGLAAECVRMTPSQFTDELSSPFIAVVKMNMYPENHFVFVKKMPTGSLYMIDRGIFAGEVPVSSFFDIWQGTGVVVLPPNQHKAAGAGRGISYAAAFVAFELIIILVLTVARRRNAVATVLFSVLIGAVSAALGSSVCFADIDRAGGETGILVDNEKVLLGKHLAGTMLTHRFTIKNSTNLPCDLEIGRRSCECATAELTLKRVDPGKESFLDVSIDTRGKAGNALTILELTTDNPDTPKLSLSLSYIVGEVFSVSASRIALDYVPRATDTVRFVRVAFDKDYDISGLIIESSSPWISHSLVVSPETESPIGEEFFKSNGEENLEIFIRICIHPDPSAPLGDFSDVLRIKSEGKSFFLKDVRITGHVVDRTRLSSNKVVLTRPRKQKCALSAIHLKNSSSILIKEISVPTLPDFVDYRIDTNRGSTQTVVHFSTDPDLQPGSYKGNLTIRVLYDDDHEESLTLAVVAVAM